MGTDKKQDEGKNRNGALLLGWVVLVLALVLYVYGQVVAPFERAMNPNDFKHIYLGSRLLRYGEDPYDLPEFFDWAKRFQLLPINPYVYPPTTGAVLMPLGYLSFRKATIAWFVLNHLMLLGSLAILVHLLFGWRNPWPIAALVLIAATSWPLRRTLTAGQLNGLLLLFYSIILWGLLKRRDWAAGLPVGLGTLVKLMPALFGLYFLLKRRWAAVIWSAGGFAVFLGMSVAMFGWSVHAEYVPLMREMGYGRSVWENLLIQSNIPPFYRDPFNQSFNSLFHHLLAPDPIGQVKPWFYLEPEVGKKAANILTIAAVLLSFALAVWAIGFRPRSPGEANPGGRPPREGLEASLVVILSLLVPSLLWDHYLILLLIPQAVLIGRYWSADRLPGIRVALLLVASVIVAMPVAFHRPEYTQGLGVLLMSVKLYGLLIVYGLLVYELRWGEGESPVAEVHGASV